LQEDARQKVFAHLNMSCLHWKSVSEGIDMELLAGGCEIWEEEPLASTVLIT
jgi:hypothetical protein